MNNQSFQIVVVTADTTPDKPGRVSTNYGDFPPSNKLSADYNMNIGNSIHVTDTSPGASQPLGHHLACDALDEPTQAIYPSIFHHITRVNYIGCEFRVGSIKPMVTAFGHIVPEVQCNSGNTLI